LRGRLRFWLVLGWVGFDCRAEHAGAENDRKRHNGTEAGHVKSPFAAEPLRGPMHIRRLGAVKGSIKVNK